VLKHLLSCGVRKNATTKADHPIPISMNESDEPEDIFKDGLLTIFGDVKDFYGDHGDVFHYQTPTG
jgi:hypothetical protein